MWDEEYIGQAGDGIRVLHVDDDPGILDVTAAYLERADDLSVRSVTSVDEGLAVLETGRVDCVVSDYDMPGRDGLGFHEAVRERGIECPFILYTGHGNEAIASEAISAGVDDYLRKGTGTEQYEVLENRIRNYVGRHRAECERERARKRCELAGRLASDVIFEWDAATDEAVFSEGTASQFGNDPPTENVTSWWIERIHPDPKTGTAFWTHSRGQSRPVNRR